MTQDVAAIARGLTKAQRHDLLNARELSGPSGDVYADDPTGELWCDDLATMGGRLRTLGLAVRAHLSSEKQS
jgi:hypothetical protein